MPTILRGAPIPSRPTCEAPPLLHRLPGLRHIVVQRLSQDTPLRVVFVHDLLDGREGIRCLDLSDNFLPFDQVDVFARGSWANLQQLSLRNNNLDVDGAETLAQASIPELREIDLEDCLISPEAAKAIGRARWPRLQCINLAWNKVRNLAAIARAEWPLLRYLNLQCNDIELTDGASSCDDLERANWPLLEGINLSGNTLGREGATALARCRWPRMRCVMLGDTRLHESNVDESVAALASAHWPDLEQLSLRHNQLGLSGAMALTRGLWPKLRELDVRCCRLGLNGAIALAQGMWPSLDTLAIGSNRMGYRGEQVCLEYFYRVRNVDMTYLEGVEDEEEDDWGDDDPYGYHDSSSSDEFEDFEGGFHRCGYLDPDDSSFY